MRTANLSYGERAMAKPSFTKEMENAAVGTSSVRAEILDTAVILAGGAGIRLYPLTNDCPKPMVKVCGKPILEWVIKWLKKGGIKSIVVGVAYHKESVINYFKNGKDFGVSITYSTHSVEGETGEAFRLAIERYVDSKTFLAMNGDELTDTSIQMLAKFHFENRPVATVLAAPFKCPFGIIKTDKNQRVVSFNEKPTIHSILVSAGIYVFEREILNYLPEKGRIEELTFPILAQKGLLLGYRLTGQWLTVNTKNDLKIAEDELRKW